ncbi:hypothetical protein FAI40_04290 [Acetobacteraceae bacterium]|nr:hypothetical protein FAI40_04290 [Acetobacteraceae bacterium]
MSFEMTPTIYSKLRKNEIPIAVGASSWGGLTFTLFEVAHTGFLVAFLISFLPGLAMAFFTKNFMKSHHEEDVEEATHSLNEELHETQIEIKHLNDNFHDFSEHLSELLAGQRSAPQNVSSSKVIAAYEPPTDEALTSLSDNLKTHQKIHKSFALWQEYKQTVIALLDRVENGDGDGIVNAHTAHLEKMRYQLAEREFLYFHPGSVIAEAVAEIDFFLPTIWKRTKEYRELCEYLQKLLADGAWLSAEKKEKIKEYETAVDRCHKQIEKDTEEVFNNLEVIFEAL